MAFESRAPRSQMMSEAPRPAASAAAASGAGAAATNTTGVSAGSGVRPSTPPPRPSLEPSLRFAAQTNVGKQREHNEDNFLVDKKLRLYVVCDGMGGHAAGEVASAVAVRTLSEEIRKSQDLLDDYVKGSTGGSRVSKRDITNMLGFAVNCASRKIHSEALLDEKKRGMGTTLVAALFL